MMNLSDLKGTNLGSKTISYTRRDAILYALSVGAPSDALDLVYERDLRVLPTYGCALGLWAVEAAGDLGAYDRKRSLHAAQGLEVHKPMPPEAEFEMTGEVLEVWDKGKASLVEIIAKCEYFTATYSIFLPGLGGWGGDRGPSSAPAEEQTPNWHDSFETWLNHAALYRLTGDLHPVHIDTEVANVNGFDRPILHGLCTLGIAARMVAQAANRHPAELTQLSARLAAPVLPGDQIDLAAVVDGTVVDFTANVGETGVLKSGSAKF